MITPRVLSPEANSETGAIPSTPATARAVASASTAGTLPDAMVTRAPSTMIAASSGIRLLSVLAAALRRRIGRRPAWPSRPLPALLGRQCRRSAHGTPHVRLRTQREQPGLDPPSASGAEMLDLVALDPAPTGLA